MQKILVFGSFLLILKMISNMAFAHGGFAPENNRVGFAIDSGVGLTQEQFDRAIAKVEKVYYPIVDEMGFELVVYKAWNSNTMNAYADRKEKKWNVTFYGGLARQADVTEDGFSLVVCHEIGHHLGGAPKKTENKWSSAEGQADYFSTLKCLRKVFEKDDNLAIVQSMEIPVVLKNKCDEIYKSPAESALCQRISMAGRSVARLLAFIEYESRVPNFETPDENIAVSTNLSHPAPQCRLDTYFSAALCDVSHAVELDDVSIHQGACTKRQGHTVGKRSPCWFSEKF
jgi:hypothetical protein